MDRKAVELLVSWIVDAGFGYDNIPDLYERYQQELENMSYTDGLIYIAIKEAEHE